MAPLRITIAITTGTVLVGSMGSEQRFQYSIVGKAIEWLIRLIRVNNAYKKDIVVTEFTQQHLGNRFQTQLLAEQLIVKDRDVPSPVESGCRGDQLTETGSAGSGTGVATEWPPSDRAFPFRLRQAHNRRRLNETPV